MTISLPRTLGAPLLSTLVLCTSAWVPTLVSAQPAPPMMEQRQGPPGQPRYAAAAISGFDVQQARQLRPGTELVFTLYGTPGGDARISLTGIGGQYALPEVEPGVYVGSYTIRTSDRLSAQSLVTANLRLGNQVASAVLDESLQAGAPWRSQAGSVPTGLAPRIERFDVAPTSRTEPGSELLFTLNGTPGAKASVRVDGLQGKIFLDETAPGRFQGDYTIKSRDRIAPNARVTASLRVGDRETTQVLRSPLVTANVVRPASLPPRTCANCGVVEAINAIEVKGEGGYLGLAGGGVAGAVLGSQIGKGSGRTAAQLLGAVGGALAGREVEKNVRKATHYEVVTRLESGGVQTVTYPEAPPVRVGDRVRLEGNGLVVY